MIGHQVEVIGLERVNRGLTVIGGALERLKPLWEAIGDEFRTEESRLFDAAPWTPLSGTHAEQKRKEFGDKPILRATDVLYKSMTEENAPGNVNRISDDSAEFGSSDFKARIHQSGTNRLPARPVLVEFDPDRAATLAGAHLLEILANAGFN
jgi:hypothetical protein